VGHEVCQMMTDQDRENLGMNSNLILERFGLGKEVNKGCRNGYVNVPHSIHILNLYTDYEKGQLEKGLSHHFVNSAILIDLRSSI
jgi:hypothetical protein